MRRCPTGNRRHTSTPGPLVTLLVGGMWATSAHATVPDVFGLGGRWQGMGGGGVAVVEDGTAAFTNPAGLARIRRPSAGIGFLAGIPKFTDLPPLWWDTNRDGALDERDPPLTYSAEPRSQTGFEVFAGRHVGGKFGLGVAAYVPSRNLVRFSTFDPELPNYIMWDNRLERYMISAGIGGELLPGLAVGAAVDTLASAQINVVLTADAVVTGPNATAEDASDLLSGIVIDVHDIELAVVPAFAPVLGVQLDVGRLVKPLDGLVLGASYHGEVGLDIRVDMDIQANATIRDVGDLDPYVTALLAEAGLAIVDHYVPPRVVLGLAYRRANALTVYADARWTDWRGMVLNVARLTRADLTTPLFDIDGKLTDGNAHQFVTRPTWGLRMGSDLTLPRFELDGDLRYVQISFRGGFSIDPSPLVDQGFNSNLLDANRTMVSLGAGLETWDPFELTDGAVRFDLFFQYHTLASSTLARQTTVPRAGYPRDAAGLPVGGTITVAGLQWSFEY